MRKLNLIGLLMMFLIVSLPVCFASEISLTYDANGNLVTGDGFYRVYNSLNQLWKVYNGTNTSGVLLETYLYDPVEERVLMKKSYNLSGNWTETVIYFDDNYVIVKNASGSYNNLYVSHEGQRIAEVDNGDNVKYILADHLGSTSVITDSNGNILEKSSYTPFGEQLTGGRLSRYDYTGQEQLREQGNIPTSNLVSYYSFEGDANDEINSNDGTVSGAVITQGKVRNAYLYDGINDKITVNYNQSLNFTNSSLSVSAWIKFERSGTSEFIAGSYNWSSFNGVTQKAWALYEYGNNSVKFYVYHNGSDENSTSKTATGLSTDTWYHIAGVWNQSSVKLYVNGALNGTATATKGTTINSVPTNIVIGSTVNSAYPFNGAIDEVGIWNRSLTANEIKDLYDYGAIEKRNELDYHARMYKSSWGKPITPDTVIQNVYDSQLLNRHSYARNNPYRYFDESGHVVVEFTGYGNSPTDMNIIRAGFTDNQPSAVFKYQDANKAKEYVIDQLTKDPNQPVILVGHSRGADTALHFARDKMADAGVEVDALIAVDKRTWKGNIDRIDTKPENVKSLITIRQTGTLRGEEIAGTDVDIILKNEKHTTILHSPTTQQIVQSTANTIYQNYKGSGKVKSYNSVSSCTACRSIKSKATKKK